MLFCCFAFCLLLAPSILFENEKPCAVPKDDFSDSFLLLLCVLVVFFFSYVFMCGVGKPKLILFGMSQGLYEYVKIVLSSFFFAFVVFVAPGHMFMYVFRCT